MGGGGTPPTPPSPQQITNNSVQAAKAQLPISSAGQQSSQYNQIDPYGRKNYGQIGTTAQGTPIWGVNTEFSGPQQQLYNTFTGTQALAGQGGANTLAAGNYSNLDPRSFVGNSTSGTTADLVGKYQQSVAPFFQTQYDQLNAQLVNQGFTPNPGGVNANVSDPAYDNAMRQLQTNQDNALLGAAAQFEPQAFSQATSLYGLPMTVGQQLAQWGAPTGPEGMFTNQLPQFATPSVGQNLSAETTAAENQWEAQQAQFNANQQAMSGLFGVGGNVLGDIALGAMIA